MPRCAIVFSLALFAAAPAAAADDPIETCRTQSATSDARIACLEAAIRAMNSAPAAAIATPTGRATSPQGLGAEQIIARNPETRAQKAESEAVFSPVAKLEYNATGRPVFYLENGQIWRGLEPETMTRRLSANRKFQASVSSGSLGGYRLRLEGVKRLYAVERLK